MMITEEWNPEHVLKNHMAEVDSGINADKSIEQVTEKVFNDHARLAALSICHIAIHSKHEARRLSAAQYVVDRVIGKPSDIGTMFSINDKEDPFARLLEDCITHSEGNNDGT